MNATCVIAMVLLSLPSGGYAYVDPGIGGSLYQLLYLAVVSGFSLLVVRPWHYIKAWFKAEKNVEIDSSDP